MNVTILIGGLSGGGAERVCCNIANYLVSKKHNVDIVTMADDVSSYEINTAVKRISLLYEVERKNFLYNTIVRYRRLIQYMRKTNCDVIVAMLPVTILSVLLLKPLSKAKIIAAERNMPALYSQYEQIFLKVFARRADGWVFQTDIQKEWYGRTVMDKRPIVIPNAINPEFVRPCYQGHRDKRIVTVGRLSRQKNHKLLIDAFASVNLRYPEFVLEIYGQGPMLEELKMYVESKDLRGRVKFMGYCSDIGEKIKSASMFVLSSDYEGIPNSLMEAMALGLPCVSTDTIGGGARLLITDKENGLLVPICDEEKLSAAMCKILSDVDFARSIGLAAHRVLTDYAPNVIYNQWENYISSIYHG